MDLKQRRQELGLTLEEVGEACGVGKSTVRKWETGAIKNMRRDKVLLLAKKLQVDPMLIIDGIDAPAAPFTDEKEDVEIPTSNAGDGMNQRLKELRTKLGMSQRDFAEAIHISQPSYTQYESGIRPPRDVTISQICTTFNVREEWLRDGTGEMFHQANTTLIDSLVQEYDLGEYGRSMLETFVTLPKEQRDNFLNFVHEFAENYRQHSAEEEKDTPAVPGRFAAAEIKKPPTRNA